MFFKTSVLALLVSAGLVAAESHTITWKNSCSFKVTPSVCANVISGYCHSAGSLASGASASYTFNGNFPAWISYASGNGVTCGTNGENCLTTEGTLQNLSPCNGCNSVDLSLIPPHAYNFGAAFTLSTGGGKSCQASGCTTAFHSDGNDGQYQVQSNGSNVGVTITFC